MPGSHKSETGQISILALVVSIALLSGTYLIGIISDLLLAQQRLTTKAESVALAGAMELEFNRNQACEIARDFSKSNYEITADCINDATSIQIFLTQTNLSPLSKSIFPSINASSRAGIAVD